MKYFMSNSILSKSVLILNTNYSPMDICSAKRAICLFYNQKVEILESYGEKVHSPSISLLLPSIIKLKNWSAICQTIFYWNAWLCQQAYIPKGIKF